MMITVPFNDIAADGLRLAAYCFTFSIKQISSPKKLNTFNQ